MSAKEKSVPLSDGDILDLFERYSLSVPIRIPTHMLDPNWGYRWINRKDQKVLTRRLGVGWKVVHKDELPSLVVKPYTVEQLNLGTHTLTDGSVAIADDLVLAKIPKRYLQMYAEAKRKRDQERIKGGRRRFHQAGELLGVATEEDI